MRSPQPLVVVDGDSLAHRAYHGLPKTTKDSNGRPANMLLGLANMLVTLWDAAAPRTILTCWDTLTTLTYRHEALPTYQSGREFDRDLLEQLDRLPELSERFGFPAAKAPGYEADDFLGRRGGGRDDERWRDGSGNQATATRFSSSVTRS